MKRSFTFDPANPRREDVLAFLCRFIREQGRKLVITVTEPKRSLEQNAAMWAALDDVSRQVKWPMNGALQLLSPDDWKQILSAGLKREQRVAAGMDGGFVILGQRTSQMSQREMGDLLELIYAFGAEHGVEFIAPDA